jgi:uncharacterized protein
MKIEGTQELRAPRERLFQALVDPEVLKRCIPGCERLEGTSDNTFSATLKAGVGPIKGLFIATVRIEELRPPEHYRIVVEGKGQPGFAKGSGDLDLAEEGPLTIIKYKGDLQVGGTIAGVGQRMIEGAAKMMAAQFFTAIEAEAMSESQEAPPKHGFFRTALRWLSGWLRRALTIESRRKLQ